MTNITVTTVSISPEALRVLILEQAEHSEIKTMCNRLATKRREVNKLHRDIYELEMSITCKVKEMEQKGINICSVRID